MAYAERRERQKGVPYRGIYKAADGSYRSAGTFSTEERALEVAREAERHALVVGGAAGGLDPGIRATRTIKEYAPLFLRHRRVEGNTKERYAAAKCRCEGCRQWARDYERERTRVQRAAASGPARRRWEKSRDPDEPYLDKQLWDRIWARAAADSGIPFKPTAYQVRHTHASWFRCRCRPQGRPERRPPRRPADNYAI